MSNSTKKPANAKEWMNYFEEIHWEALGYGKNKK